MAHENLAINLDGWEIRLDPRDGTTKEIKMPSDNRWTELSPRMNGTWKHLYDIGAIGPRDPRFPLTRDGLRYGYFIYDAIEHKQNRAAGIPDPPDPDPEPLPTTASASDSEMMASQYANAGGAGTNPYMAYANQDSSANQAPPPAGDDLDENDGANVERESAENMQNDDATDGLDTGSSNTDYYSSGVEDTEDTDSNVAVNALRDISYGRVVDGWNQKLKASSKEISSLVPFCELYAIFDADDLVSNSDSTRFTGLSNRLIDITFTGVGGGAAPLPDGLTPNCKVAKVAGDNKSQMESDSAIKIEGGTYKEYSSFKGIPGINDLAISRGSSAAQSVKYDLTITLPNPEIINEQFEYSKLMLMNSPFLLIYGWNVKDTNFDVDHFPPTVSDGSFVPVGSGVGGFWSSTIMSLSNFQFNFDNVGHLVGKLTFLNPPGIFLGTMQVSAVGDRMNKSLTDPSQQVLERVKNNQNFIWQNGVPWSPPVDQGYSLSGLSDKAFSATVIKSFFGNDIDGWTTDAESLFAAKNYNVTQAADLRDRINKLKELGELFLDGFRMQLVGDLYFNQDQNYQISMNERDHFNELEEMGMTRDASDDAESAKIVESIPAFVRLIDKAWNLFFTTRFDGEDNPQNVDDQATANYNRTAVWRIGTISTRASAVTGGGTYGDFYLNTFRGTDPRAAGARDIKFVTRSVGKGIVAPIIFEEEITSSPYSANIDPSSYIKQMPPFGVTLQNGIIQDFSNESNPNYNLLYGPSPTIVQNVRSLIHMTSVLSVPVPVPQEQSEVLDTEDRKYSEIMDSAEAQKEVLMTFHILNDVATGAGDGESFRSNLHKIVFFTSDVPVSLSIDEEIRDVVQGYNDQLDQDPPIPVEFNEDQLYGMHLSKVYSNAGDGRFVQMKYAILKNGYVVRQYRENENKEFVDQEPAQLVVDANGAPTGVFFLTKMMPLDSQSLENLSDYEVKLKNAVKSAEKSVDDYSDTNDATDQGIRDRKVKAETQRAMYDTFNVLNTLIEAIISATEGSKTLAAMEAGTNITDQLVTTTPEGETTHVILRQPVYFFLGSVLESLRMTVNNKVKFFYSRVPDAQDGKPFSIDIPENTGNSIKSTYAAEIQELTNQMIQLNGGPIERDGAGRILLVPPIETPAETQQEIDDATLKTNQNRWDEALADYIKKRGQDVASLGYNDKGQIAYSNNLVEPYKSQGVYNSYTSIGGTFYEVKARNPYFGWYDGTGKNHNGRAHVYYKAEGKYRNEGYNNPGNYRNIRAPWIYRIGKTNSYYAKDGPYQAGVATEVGRWPLNQHGNLRYTWKEKYAGFMRLWRPEDLQAAILAADYSHYDSRIYWRKSLQSEGTAGNPVNNAQVDRDRGGYPSFFTDSFGQGGVNSNPGMPDYGLQNAGVQDDRVDGEIGKQAIANFYSVNTHSRKGVVVQQLIGWLNWIPASSNQARWPALGGPIHLSYGTVNYSTPWPDPTRYFDDVDGKYERALDQDSRKNIAGWYKIKWTCQRPSGFDGGGDGALFTEEFWVRGLVVDDFVSFNGARPTAAYPSPRISESALDTANRYAEMDILKARINELEDLKKSSDLTTIFKTLPIRSTFEIPVNINTVKQFLTSEPRAPLHNLLKKILSAVKETIPNMQISMRPLPGDSSYIDVFPSSLNYDGAIQEVFTEVELNGSSSDPGQINIQNAGGDIERIKAEKPKDLLISEKVMVCQFGMGHSLVENFGLSSKIDPTAFSAFRLPAVVGGAEMSVLDAIRNSQLINGRAVDNLVGDFADILKKGVTTGIEGLKALKIISVTDDGIEVNESNLTDFLLTENVPAISKAAVGFIEDMMAQDVTVYNKILLMQNEYFTGNKMDQEGTTGSGGGGNQSGSNFYGSVLSTFLRTATLTIHGTTGLNVFNLVYLKGLLSGVEGLYLISSVNESLAASTFTTTLECKLVEYKNSNEETNPLAYKGQSDLRRLARIIEEGKTKESKEYGQDYGLDELNTYIVAIDDGDGTNQ